MNVKLLNKTWHDLPVYRVKVRDLLGVRGSVTSRRLPRYAEFIAMFHHEVTSYPPVICFVGGDGRWRVKYGNLLYWTAKETNTEYLNCVFPVGIDATDLLSQSWQSDIAVFNYETC